MKKEMTVYCKECGENVGYHYHPVNHWENLAITIITFGLWFPMWLIMTFAPTKICNECNEPIWDIK